MWDLLAHFRRAFGVRSTSQGELVLIRGATTKQLFDQGVAFFLLAIFIDVAVHRLRARAVAWPRSGVSGTPLSQPENGRKGPKSPLLPPNVS